MAIISNHVLKLTPRVFREFIFVESDNGTSIVILKEDAKNLAEDILRVLAKDEAAMVEVAA